MNTLFKTVAVVGAGAMGKGIAQIAAQTGSQVLLFDTQAPAIEQAIQSLATQWGKLAEKGRITPEQAQQFSGNLRAATTLQDIASADLVIEAIVERLDVKQKVFSDIEALVSVNTILATNTSSLSVTAIAAKLQHPQRFAGYHFFNPVPLMKVVEVIPGLKTDPAVCQTLSDYARQMGHTAVTAQDTRIHRQSRRARLWNRVPALDQRRRDRFCDGRSHPEGPGRLQVRSF